MDQECPLVGGVLDSFRQRATERKGRPSIETLDVAKGSGARTSKGSTDPSSKSKKRPREGSNISTTTPSPGSMPTPPPRREAIEVDSPSPR